MTTEQIFGGHFRWTCPLCGATRSDYGADATSRLQGTHYCREGDDMYGKTALYRTWEALDKVVAEIMELRATPTNPRFEAAKAEAKGMAIIMAIWTAPDFVTPDAIAKESMRRYKSWQAGEEPVTPGTGGWTMVSNVADATPRPKPSATERPSTPAPRRAPAAVEITLNAQQQATLKQGFTSGMFTKQQLAKGFNVSLAQVDAIISV